jgi:hypothetical protein
VSVLTLLHLTDVLNLSLTTWFSYNAYRMYLEDSESYNLRSEKKKKKHGNRIKVRRNFPKRIKRCMCYYILHALYVF